MIEAPNENASDRSVPQSLEEIWEYRRFIAAVIARTGPFDREDIDDLIVDVAIHTWSVLGTFEGGPNSNFNGWLARLTVNTARDSQRRRGRFIDKLPGVHEQETDRQTDGFKVIENRDLLRSLYDRAELTQTERQVLWLSVANDFPTDEGVVLTGLPRTTYFNQRRSALRRLQTVGEAEIV